MTELEVILPITEDVGLGLSVAGGTNSPWQEAQDGGFYITEVMEDGAGILAKLLVGDRIMKIGDVDVENVAHEDAVEALKMELEKESPTITIFRAAVAETQFVQNEVFVRENLKESQEDSSDKHSKTAIKNGNPTLTSDVIFEEINTSGPGGFGCRLPQLVELIAERGTNGLDRLYKKFGGPEGLAKKLNTSLDNGIDWSDGALENRRSIFGANSTPTPRAKNIFELMWEAFQDPILIVLIISAVLSIILNITVEKNYQTGYIEGVAIIVSCFIVVVVTAVNDLQKEKQFQELKAKQESQHLANVVRSGESIQVVYSDLVVGDIVEVQGGLVLPADGILFLSNDVMTDESALTGESYDIKKSPITNPWLLSGTSVKQGTGRMIVTCVGLFSEEGIIQKLITKVGVEESRRLEELSEEGLSQFELKGLKHADDFVLEVDVRQRENFDDLPEEDQEKILKREEKKEEKKNKESILQKKLEKMALQIGYGATFFAVLTILVLVLYYVIDHYGVKKEKYHTSMWNEFVDYFILGITVLVVAIPEGLPLAVTISLAYSVKKMMKDHNLVRVLAACETMGNATTICSDKTGTLTKNRMTVVHSWVGGQMFENARMVHDTISKNVLQDITEAVALNSDFLSTYIINEEDGLPIQQNNKTECACLYFADELGLKKHKEIRDNATNIVKSFPFNSAKKRMQTIVKLSNGVYRMYVKGASEIVLGMSTGYVGKDGATVSLSERGRDDVNTNVIVHFAEQALRVICLAYRDFNAEHDWESEEDKLLSDLTIQCFVGIQDPVRDEVPSAVATCKSAGVVVRMVTGDNLVTGRAIARNCGIITNDEEDLVMEGPEFRRRVVKADGSLDYDEINKIWPKLRVLARCSPTDKFNLVRGLIKAGEVVAVTGDGTNDGPALSEADVGFSMGIAGTDVAKEASDIIITDDNFSSIVKAISWGRNVYDSISKFLVFQLTVNVVAILATFIAACVLQTSALRAVHLLWVNLIMDTFAALALATEPPSPDLLDRDPYGRNKALLSRIMLRQIIGHSIYQLVIILILIFHGHKIFNIESGHTSDVPTQHFTIVFNTFVWMQIFNEFNARVIDDRLVYTYGNGKVLRGPIGAFLRPFHGFLNNNIFILVVVGTAVAQVVIVFVGGEAIFTKSLSGVQWVACLAFGAFGFIWNVVIHYIFPWQWIPESWEPGQYNELTPDRADEIEKEDSEDKTVVVLPVGGLDAPLSPSRSRSATLSSRDRAYTLSVATPPLSPSMRRHTTGGLLWLRIGRRLRTQMRVTSAFRQAGHLARLRRRTSSLATHALGGPDARAPSSIEEATQRVSIGEEVPSPARAMWRTAFARIRVQLRAVNAFKEMTKPHQHTITADEVDRVSKDAGLRTDGSTTTETAAETPTTATTTSTNINSDINSDQEPEESDAENARRSSSNSVTIV
eukprot:m.135364 g.135364  ORF g.135364 m.135364 type:complete len:1429 (-) comp9952_c0_seq1:212-4498(-)